MKPYLIFLILSIFTVSIASKELDKPRFDPFAKPSKLPPSLSKTDNSESLFSNKKKLTATLRAGKNSMVSIEGKIVLLGEKINGYKLIEVNDQSAVFVNNDQRVLLSLDNQ